MQSMSQRTMSACCVLGVAAIIFAQSGLADAVPAAPRPIVLKAARLFDSVSGKLTEHGVLMVSGTKIQAVGGDARIPENAEVIDLGDAPLLPGFIDAHVHLSQEASRNWYHDWFDGIVRFPAEQAMYGAHYAKATLEAGVTTVRDVGSSDYVSLGLRNGINAGGIPGPRLHVAHYGDGATGGHTHPDPGPGQHIAGASAPPGRVH